MKSLMVGECGGGESLISSSRSKSSLSQRTVILLGQCFKAILHLVYFGKISNLITWKYEGTESIKLSTTKTNIEKDTFKHRIKRQKNQNK